MSTMRVVPLTPELWPAFSEWFGSRDTSTDCRWCWCLFWRQRGMDFSNTTAQGNRDGLRELTERAATSGPAPGLVAIDVQTGDLIGRPDIVNRGFVHEATSADILEEARERVIVALAETAASEVIDPTVLQQDIRRVLKRYFFEVTQRKPVILPVIMEA